MCIRDSDSCVGSVGSARSREDAVTLGDLSGHPDVLHAWRQAGSLALYFRRCDVRTAECLQPPADRERSPVNWRRYRKKMTRSRTGKGASISRWAVSIFSMRSTSKLRPRGARCIVQARLSFESLSRLTQPRSTNRPSISLRAVSYTHLDVYKRQQRNAAST